MSPVQKSRDEEGALAPFWRLIADGCLVKVISDPVWTPGLQIFPMEKGTPPGDALVFDQPLLGPTPECLLAVEADLSGMRTLSTESAWVSTPPIIFITGFKKGSMNILCA